MDKKTDQKMLLLLWVGSLTTQLQPSLSCRHRGEEEAIVKKPKRRINGEGSVYQRKSDGRWVGQFKDPAALGSGIRYVYAKTQQEA
jgi:hypothetical protein